MKKNVIIVEDDRGIRQELIKILELAPDINCLGAFMAAEEALSVIIQKKPDVVLMDIKLPKMSGIECVAQIKRLQPEMQVIMVTVYEDTERIFGALKAGANGYLVKSSPPEQILEAIRDVYNGGAPLSSHIARKVVRYFHMVEASNEESENLSAREQEVLDFLAMGYIYREIGAKMNISSETVRTYVKIICHKMHVRSRIEAVARHCNVV